MSDATDIAALRSRIVNRDHLGDLLDEKNATIIRHEIAMDDAAEAVLDLVGRIDLAAADRRHLLAIHHRLVQPMAETDNAIATICGISPRRLAGARP